MQTTFSRRASFALLACAMLSASCGLEKQTAPDLTGPSEFATSVTLTASPEIVARDGASQSVITATVRGINGEPVAGRRLTLGINPSNGGSLSTAEVVTNANGTATVVYTAPSIDTPVNTVEVTATPSETNFDNAATRNVAIALVGPASATPEFAVTPVSPQQFQLTTFNASATAIDGQTCGSACTYTWDFGGEGSATGMAATYRFQRQQSYVVVLSVKSPGGVTTTTQQTVTVTAGTAPTATFTVSPTAPVAGQTLYLNASSSRAANDATIVEYTWDYGNGSTGSGVTTSTSFAGAGSYIIRLTVRDSNGVTATTTQSVTVANPTP